MEVKIESNSVMVNGSVATISDFHKVREVIDQMKKDNTQGFVLKLYDTHHMTSALLGHLLKIRQKDGVPVKIYTNSDSLLSLLKKMELSDVFAAELIQKND